MTDKHIEATNNRPNGARVIDALGVTVDIQSFVKEIKKRTRMAQVPPQQHHGS